LKQNNEIYTVFQVILVNDVFNYPEYKNFIASFGEMNENNTTNDLLEWKQMNENALWYTINIQLNNQEWKIMNTYNRYPTGVELAYLKAYNQIFDPTSDSILFKFRELQEQFYLKIDTIVDSIDISIVTNPNLSELFKQKAIKPPLEKPEEILKWKQKTITYPILVDLYKVSPVETIKNLIQTYKDFKEKFKTFIRDYYKLDLLNANYNLFKVVQNMNKLFIEERAIQMSDEKNTNYDNEAFGKEIKEIMNLKNKNYTLFSVSRESLTKTRKVNNPFWNSFLQEKDKNVIKNFLKDIQTCKTKDKCPKSIVKKLKVHVDELYTKNEKNTRIYEAVVMLNLIQGEITLANYTRVQCSFLNQMIGNLMGQLKRQSEFHDIEDEKVFFSLKEELSKLKDIKDTKKQAKVSSNKTRKGSRPK
jgi:hypothetical protein